FQNVDISAVVDRAWRVDMAAAMARQENKIGAFVGAEQERIGRRAPGRLDRLPARLFQAGNIIDAAAADDAEYGSGHGEVLTVPAHKSPPPRGEVDASSVSERHR